MCGIILITVPTIQYGSYFLLTSLMNRTSGYMENPLRQNFFRAGHAHAGVIVILSLVCQILADAAVLPPPLLWFVRIGVLLSAILMSAGFFFSMLPPAPTAPSGAVRLIYPGTGVLAISSSLSPSVCSELRPRRNRRTLTGRKRLQHSREPFLARRSERSVLRFGPEFGHRRVRVAFLDAVELRDF